MNQLKRLQRKRSERMVLCRSNNIKKVADMMSATFFDEVEVPIAGFIEY